MGTIVSSFFTTVDGVVEAPHRFHFPYFDEAMGQVVDETMQGAEAFLMGRRLYDEWSDYWGDYAAGGEDQSFADTINAMPKYVVSTTLTDPAWRGRSAPAGAALLPGARHGRPAPALPAAGVSGS